MVGSDRASLFLVDHAKRELYAQVFDVHVDEDDVIEDDLTDLTNNNEAYNAEKKPHKEIR